MLFLLRLAVTAAATLVQVVSAPVAVIVILLALPAVHRDWAGAACVLALGALVVLESAVPAVLVLLAWLVAPAARAVSPLFVSLGSGLGFLSGAGAVFAFLLFVRTTGVSFGLHSSDELYYVLTPPLLGSSLGILLASLIRRGPRRSRTS